MAVSKNVIPNKWIRLICSNFYFKMRANKSFKENKRNHEHFKWVTIFLPKSLELLLEIINSTYGRIQFCKRTMFTGAIHRIVIRLRLLTIWKYIKLIVWGYPTHELYSLSIVVLSSFIIYMSVLWIKNNSIDLVLFMRW